MRTITATFEVVTPMFLGAADQEPDGIRPASIKGALRFWWRAWAWDGIRRQHPNDLQALQALHHQETRLFGLAAKQGNQGETLGGQGQFMLHVRDNSKAATAELFGKNFDNGILYLLGMGLGSFQGGNHCLRKAIPTASSFEVKLIFKPPSPSLRETSATDQHAIACALQLFGLLGALGSRGRHGMGSVRLTKLAGTDITEWQAPKNVQQYKQLLHQLLPQGLLDQSPPLSAFSRKTRIDLSTVQTDFIKLLKQLGREQQAYRSYGKDGWVNDQKSEQNFEDDHDLVLAATQGKEVRQAPRRVVFGLPHNYYFSSTKGKADVNYRPSQGEGRRSSPLLLHIHRLGDEEYVAVHTLLQAQFLPSNHAGQSATVEIKSRKNSHIVLPDSAVQWDVLHQYLDRYTDRETIYG